MRKSGFILAFIVMTAVIPLIIVPASLIFGLYKTVMRFLELWEIYALSCKKEWSRINGKVEGEKGPEEDEV